MKDEPSAEAMQAAILSSYEQKLAGCKENGPEILATVSALLMMGDVDVTGTERKPASDHQYKLMAAAVINDLLGPERLRSYMEGRDSVKKQEGSEYPRLSVNMHEDVAAVLKARMVKDRIDATEAVRRAITVWDFCMSHNILVEEADCLYEVEGLGVRSGSNTSARRGWLSRLVRIFR